MRRPEASPGRCLARASRRFGVNYRGALGPHPPSPWPRLAPGRRDCIPGATAASQPPQKAQLAIEQRARPCAVDLPAPRIGQIERAADLPGTAVRHVPEPPWIAAVAATTLGEIEHDTAGRALDLISCIGTVLP